MTNTTASVQDWMDAVIPAAEELATVALGMEDFELLEVQDSQQMNSDTAYIAVVGQQTSVQLGVSASAEGCQQLARALLAMEPEEEDLSDEEVVDAIGEIANILAGQVKRLMAQTDNSLNLGMPIFIHGKVKTTDEMEMAIANMRIGTIPVSFLVLKSNMEEN